MTTRTRKAIRALDAVIPNPPLPSSSKKPDKNKLVERRNLYSVSPRRTWTADSISAAIAMLDTGRYEQLADLATLALNDAVASRAYYIRRSAVAGREFTVNPPKDVKPEYKDEAERLALIVRNWLQNMDSVESFLMRTLESTLYGVSCHELNWSMQDDAWLPDLSPIMTRELKYNKDWVLEARNFNYDWINTFENPSKFFIHNVYQNNARPTDQGCAIQLLWLVLFKKACIQFELSAAERFGSPLVLAHMSPGTDRAQRDAALQDLQELVNDSVGVSIGTNALEIVDAAAGSSTSIYKDIIKQMDEQIFICLGVPPDLMIAASNNGSRSANDTRNTVRLESTWLDSKLMWAAINRDIVSWIRHYNQFSPDCPLPVIESIFENQVEISDSAIKSQCITKNELRKAAGLPAWSKEQGGDDIATMETVTVSQKPGDIPLPTDKPVPSTGSPVAAPVQPLEPDTTPDPTLDPSFKTGR